MKNYTIKCILLGLTLGFMSCSKDSDDLENEIHDLSYTSSESHDFTSGGNCHSMRNFKDLVVETSWISNNTGDRDTFDACEVDNESWMDKLWFAVDIKCRAGDGHRSELKEDSGDEAGLNTYKKMSFKGKLSSIPSNGVTIAQIHNRGSNVKRPWLRVYVDKDDKIKVKETETNPTGSSSSYSTYTGPSYTEGNDMEVTIWTGLSGQTKAKITVKTGGQTWTKNNIKPSSDWNSKSSSYYLKAGVYTEGDDKQPQMRYSKFYIYH